MIVEKDIEESLGKLVKNLNDMKNGILKTIDEPAKELEKIATFFYKIYGI